MLGADLPFCIAGGGALVEGIGEQVIPQPVMPKSVILVAYPGKGVSTPEAYALLDKMYGDFRKRKPVGNHHPMTAAISAGDLPGTCSYMYNIFEDCIIPGHPEVAQIKQIMLDRGASATQMSGSGPAVFGIFTDNEAAVSALRQLRSENIAAYTCIPTEPFTI
jgi:4-diphosphocytidyl-2-C-methyl-D-erythritol kinase